MITKKFICYCLSVAMVLALLCPLGAFAAESEAESYVEAEPYIAEVEEKDGGAYGSYSTAPFISAGGSSYIPARVVAESFGYDVYWDSYYETVVVIDTVGLIADIDKDFTVLNKLLGMLSNTATDEAGVLKSILSILAPITVFNSLDGDTVANLGADMSILTDGRNFNITIDVDLEGLVDLILATDPYGAADISEVVMNPDDIEMLELLVGAKAELILNYDEDMLYVKAPFLNSLIPELPAGAWIAVSEATDVLAYALFGTDYYYLMEELEPDEQAGADGGGLSVGMVLLLNNLGFSPIHLCEYIKSDAQDLKAILGDGKIKINGDDYTIKLTIDDIMGAARSDPYYGYDDYGYEYGYYSYSQTAFELEVTVKTDGEAVTGISGRFFMREDYYSSATQMKCEFDISAQGASISFELHEKNTYVISVVLDMSTEELVDGTETILGAPPVGEKVIPIEELMPDEFGAYEQQSL